MSGAPCLMLQGTSSGVGKSLLVAALCRIFARTGRRVALPGSKSTVADLAWLRARGLAEAIVAAAGAGRPLLGVCGGYQMLGRTLLDPHGVESSTAVAPGLGLLAVDTTFAPHKTTVRVRVRATGAPGPFARSAGVLADAYEIHAGVTHLLEPGVTRPFAVVSRAAARR